MMLVVDDEFRAWCLQMAAQWEAEGDAALIESDDLVQLTHYCGGWTPEGDRGPGFYFSYYSADGGDWIFRVGLEDLRRVGEGGALEPALEIWKESPLLSEFSLRFDLADVETIAARYAQDDDERIIARGERARERGHLTLDDLIVIGEWKSPRVRSRIASNDAESVEEITRFALSAKSERARVEGLTILTGVGWPMASVILHFCHKDRYPILDFRALWSVGAEEPSSWNFPFWWAYTEHCRRLADEAGVSMRTLDQALWQWSKEEQGRG